MKYTHFLKLGIVVAALVLAGCAKPADPSRTSESTTSEVTPSSSPVASNVIQLQNDWTLINFGAPW